MRLPMIMGLEDFEMKEQTNNEQAFFENANEAATKIREIYHIFGGYGSTSSPEEGTLLGDVYARVWDMISLYLASIMGKDPHSDELNDITCEAMRMDKEGIGDFIRKYCKISA